MFRPIRAYKLRACGVVLSLVALLVSSSVSAQDDWRSNGVSRVVAVGDVHGAYRALTELLKATDLIDEDLSWIGGNAHFVSLGDLLDRGPESRAAMDLLMRLQDEAAGVGGRVHVVLGNHELMNLIGDLRYVSAEEYAAFAADESSEERDAAFDRLAATSETRLERSVFDRMYPPGYFAHRAAFAPDGRYGRWLMSLPAIVVVNRTAYVHGGLPELVAETSLEDLNRAVQAQVRRYLDLREDLAEQGLLHAFDMQRDWELARAALESATGSQSAQVEEFVSLIDAPELGASSPLWYRGSIYCKPILEEPRLDAALAKLGVDRVVVGHTPTTDRRVRAIYDGRLVMLDTGMLTAYYHGRPAALVLEGDGLDVQYVAPVERVAVTVGEPKIAEGMTEAELATALREGTVTSVEPATDDAPLRVMLTYGETTLSAWFYADDAGGPLELAAAGLDDLLGTALVPLTVRRSIEGDEGALQLRLPDAVSEAARLERGLALSGWCPIQPQLQLLYAFDVLTFNRGRSTNNVFYVNEVTDLIATDYGDAFGTERALPSGIDPQALAMTPPLLAAMRALDAETLEASIGDWLDSRRIRALLSRRDRLVADR